MPLSFASNGWQPDTNTARLALNSVLQKVKNAGLSPTRQSDIMPLRDGAWGQRTGVIDSICHVDHDTG
jgi:hypothetical protein